MRIGKKILTPGKILFLVLVTVFPLQAVAEEVPFPVSMYVESALTDNPSLESMRERVRMKENAAIKAGALDDPKLRLGIVNLPTRSWDFHEEDMTGKEIGLSQMFPWPGMRKTRTEMVLREKERGGIRP